MKEALVIGAGIAGASVAYFLTQRGIRVTVVDQGHTASHVPAALINPVRGQSGRLDPQAIMGMNRTWALIHELNQLGRSVTAEQCGVFRPVPDEKTKLKFEKNAPGIGFWQAPQAPLKNHWHQVLCLPQGGWIDGESLCSALLSGHHILQEQASWNGTEWLLSDTTRWSARQTFFCGGSYGVSLLAENNTHRMGSVVRISQRVPVCLSFGGYVTNAKEGGILGGTFEKPSSAWQSPRLPLESLSWLLDKGSALCDLGDITGHWTGSRLSGLQMGTWSGGYRLTGLGSKGFLLGPLLAEQLVNEALVSTDWLQ